MKRYELHANFIHTHQQVFSQIKTRNLCLGCFIRPYEYRLPCQCSMCASCVSTLGKIMDKSASAVIRFQSCPLCCLNFEVPTRLRIPPPTAGYRLLELDGGGIKGIVQIIVLQKLQDIVQLPMAMFLDLATGTSAGKFISSRRHAPKPLS